MDSVKPLVSVVIPTYQHVGYIEQCLRSVLTQNTSFQVEILLGEDESSDGTREICQRFAVEYPERIRLFLWSRKDMVRIMGKPTGRANLMGLLKETKGKYVAICEGDDYWTDPLKLQKQVDFLEAHPDFSMCFHRAMLLKHSGLEEHSIPDDVDRNNVRYDDLLRTSNFIATASVVFRRRNEPLPTWFWELPFLDKGLYHYLSGEGKLKCLPEFMSVYRISGTGVWSKLSVIDQHKSYLRFYTVIGPYLTPAQRKIVVSKRKEVLKQLAKDSYPGNSVLQKLFITYLRITNPL